MNKLLRILWLLPLIVFSVTFSLKAEMTRLIVDDGLPNTSIYQILQDDAGYIWFGSTNTGLLRYDGGRFEAFDIGLASASGPRTVPDIDAMLLSEDELWLGTWGMGLNRLTISNGSIQHYSTGTDSALALQSNFIQSLYKDSQKRLWIGSRDGLQRLDPDGRLHSIGGMEQELPLVSQRVWAFSQSPDGRVWIATSQGLHWYSDSAGLSAAVQIPELIATEIRALHRQGNLLWVVARNRLIALDSRTMHAVQMRLPDDFPLINAVMDEPDSQRLLLATFDGIYRFDTKDFRLMPFEQGEVLLPGVNVRSLFIDRSGVLWAGSREKGLFYGRYTESAFSSLRRWGPELAEVAQKVPTAVLAEKSDLWLGTSDALYRINRQHKAVQAFPLQSRVNAIRRDQQGRLWVGTDTGLLQVDEVQGRLYPWQAQAGQIPPILLNVRDVQSSLDGSLWLGLWQGGVVQIAADGQAKQFLNKELEQILGDAVQSMEMIDQKLWIGTRYSGTFVLDTRSGQLLSLKQYLNLPDSEQYTDIQCIAKGPGQTVLLCSSEQLLLVDTENKLVTDLSAQFGSADVPLLGAYTDELQNIWLMTSKGLKLKNINKNQLVVFGPSDGLNNDEMLFKVLSASPDGELYFGTSTGLAVVKPAELQLNQHAPQVRISEIRIGTKQLKPSIMQVAWPDLVLEPGQGLELRLTSLDYHDPARNQYIYRLEGMDAEWQYGQGPTKVLYHQLAAGEYRFVFRGSNQHGLFTLEERAVHIRVLPHWWQRVEIIALAVGLVVLLIIAVHAYRLRHIRQINKLLQQSVQERANTQLALETMVTQRTKQLEDSSVTLSLRSRQLEHSLAKLAENNHELTRLNRLKDEFISTVSHELRTPLTSIRGAVGLVASGAVLPSSEHYQQLLQTALGNAERLSNLINDLLDVQKFESGHFQLHQRQLDLASLVEDAVAALTPYANEYQIRIDMKLQSCVVFADPNRLTQVLDNLLSNAIKFSEPGQGIRIELYAKDTKAHLEVQDEGCGISDEFRSRVFEKFSQADSSSSRKAEGTGLGLTICKTIIEAHHGQIGFYSQTGQGSTFWFELALAESAE
ncbi:ATP-binding protein [Rheinheimera marina]